MQCTCSTHSTKMKFIYCWDDPDEGFAFNVFACDECGKLVKNDVWNNSGNTTIRLNGNVLVNGEIVYE